MLYFYYHIFPVLFVFDGGIFERMSGMRLIDVDEITDGEIVKYLGKEYVFCVPDVRNLLKDQPVAYDRDRVIEQLDSLPICSRWNHNSDNINRSAAIEIVKRGGRDVKKNDKRRKN